MCSGEKPIPADHCKAIEKFSGGEVTCIEMRPDDWHKYWPELAAAQSQQAPPAIKTDGFPESDQDPNAMRTGAVRRVTTRRVHEFDPAGQTQPQANEVA